MRTEVGRRGRVQRAHRPVTHIATPLLSALVTLGLIVAGVQVTRAALSGHDDSHRLATATGSGPFVVGQPVRADGPVFEVTGLEQLGGPTSKDLGNANHGIANGVRSNQVQVQVTVRLTNDSSHAMRYSAQQFRLRVGAAKGVKAMSSTLPDGRLAPGASAEGNLGFVAPRTGNTLRLELPSKGGPIFISLGRADSTRVSDDGHQH